jgi:hypothetical protein
VASVPQKLLQKVRYFQKYAVAKILEIDTQGLIGPVVPKN